MSVEGEGGVVVVVVAVDGGWRGDDDASPAAVAGVVVLVVLVLVGRRAVPLVRRVLLLLPVTVCVRVCSSRPELSHPLLSEVRGSLPEDDSEREEGEDKATLSP